MQIRDAREQDAAELTQLARRAKASWGYPQEWLQEWESELSFSAAYLRDQAVLVAASDGELIGVIALEEPAGERVIGLFQGMFERNILTFNPGWDGNATAVDSFTDVRELQRQLKAQGVELQTEADETTSGPASFVAVDPDGNPVLVDQHV